MGHISRTPAGTFRANWRDDADKQKAKTFKTRKAAAAFLAQVESGLTLGTYVDPHAGRQLFGPYAERWLKARTTEHTTSARDISVMRTNVMPRWESVPIGRIEHLAVQTWVSELGERLAPSTVAVCLRILAHVLRTAVRDRVIGTNPADGIKVRKQRRQNNAGETITPETLKRQLLPVVPERYRALVALAGGTGMRWGEAIGVRWDVIDLEVGEVEVIRTMIEVAGTVSLKPYPKSRAGQRVIPLPHFVVEELKRHRKLYLPGASGEVFTNSAGGPMRRTLFRSRVWRPALVRAGLLGDIQNLGESRFEATWADAAGTIHRRIYRTEREAVNGVARDAAEGLRFHDLRHSYATWLVSQGLPVNDVQRVMGHERASTTLDLYTHRSDHGHGAVRDAFADDPLTIRPKTAGEDHDQDDDEGDAGVPALVS